MIGEYDPIFSNIATGMVGVLAFAAVAVVVILYVTSRGRSIINERDKE